MKITAPGLSAMDVANAVERANTLYDGNIEIRPDISETTGRNGTTVNFRIRVKNSRGKGASITGNMGRERRSIAACWHAYRDVIGALFIAYPRAVAVTAMAKYDTADGFLNTYPETGERNIGSQVFPMYAEDACKCRMYDEILFSSIIEDVRKIA